MQSNFLTEKLPPYIFEAIHILKKEVAARGVDIIDFGMGNPDSAPPAHVMEKLQELAKNPKLYGYSLVGGIDELKREFCNYYARRFGVTLNYKTEALVTIGAKEGLTSLATAICGADDHFVVASPSYPIHTFAFKIAKSRVHHINAIASKDFLQQFKEYVAKASRKPLAVIVNYPCNPTSEVVGIDFYEELVAFCKHHQIYIISDIAYAELYFDENHIPPSILQVEGAKDVAIEFSSVSKSYSLAGARIGFAAGNQDLVRALYKIKSYLDYGSFEPLQIAAALALTSASDQYLEDLRAKYKSRAQFMIKMLHDELGWKVEMPKASMFLWTKLPQQFSHMKSFEFTRKLLEETGVAFSSGSGFGENGEGFVRMSMIHDEGRMQEAVGRLKKFFAMVK